MKFALNKGIGKSAEFKGLKAQYLFSLPDYSQYSYYSSLCIW